MPQPTYFDKIKKNMHDANFEFSQINAISQLTSKYLNELRQKYNCCCDVIQKFNDNGKIINSGIQTYNDFLTKIKTGKWIHDSKFLIKTFELIKISKELKDQCFKIDKEVHDKLYQLGSVESEQGKDSSQFKNMLSILQLPPPPSGCPLHKSSRGGKLKRNKKSRKIKRRKNKRTRK